MHPSPATCRAAGPPSPLLVAARISYENASPLSLHAPPRPWTQEGYRQWPMALPRQQSFDSTRHARSSDLNQTRTCQLTATRDKRNPRGTLTSSTARLSSDPPSPAPPTLTPTPGSIRDTTPGPRTRQAGHPRRKLAFTPSPCMRRPRQQEARRALLRKQVHGEAQRGRPSKLPLRRSSGLPQEVHQPLDITWNIHAGHGSWGSHVAPRSPHRI